MLYALLQDSTGIPSGTSPVLFVALSAGQESSGTPYSTWRVCVLEESKCELAYELVVRGSPEMSDLVRAEIRASSLVYVCWLCAVCTFVVWLMCLACARPVLLPLVQPRLGLR